MEQHATGAGFTTVFQANRPPGEGQSCPQAYLLARRR
ncbi:hypothetical protein BJ973_004827 [Actinoplanes tereljensis]